MKGDADQHPGLKSTSYKNYFIRQWNLNRIPAYNYVKVLCFGSHISINGFDIACLRCILEM